MATKNHLYNYQNTYSKWLLTAILILSFFNFSGFTISTPQIKQDAQQTAQLGNIKTEPSKSISYKRAINLVSHARNSSIPGLTDQRDLALFHTRLFHVQMALYKAPYLNIQKISLFYSPKSVAQNDDDDLNMPTA